MAESGGCEVKSLVTTRASTRRSRENLLMLGVAAAPTPSQDQAKDSGPRGDGDEGQLRADDKTSAGSEGRKKRHRRSRKAGEHHQNQASKRPWKPYTDMSWEERRAKDQDDAIRATRRRDRRVASGQAMAPYNNNQFLMDQYDNEDVEPRRLSGSVSGGDTSSPDLDDNGEEDSDLKEMLFLHQKEFAEDYEIARADHLRTRTKEELIRDLVDMETKVETMKGRYVGPFPEDWDAEVQRLKAENARLVRENCRLRTEMAALRSSQTTAAPIDATAQPFHR